MDDHPVHTIPNHHPNKLGCILTKTLVQIILAAKWLVRHSSTRPTTNRDDFCLLFCICPSSMRLAHAACFLWSLKPGVCVETSVLSPHSKVGVLHTSGSICFRILKLGVYRKTRFRIKLILSRFEPFDCSGSRFSRNLRVFFKSKDCPRDFGTMCIVRMLFCQNFLSANADGNGWSIAPSWNMRAEDSNLRFKQHLELP